MLKKIGSMLLLVWLVLGTGAGVFAEGEALELETPHAILIEVSTGTVLYEKDADFRALIDSGQYIYADGHIVRNDPAFFRDGVHGSRLSVWANAHVDQCCVRFARQYVQQHVGKYVFGRMNFDADYVKQTCFYIEGNAETIGVDELMATKMFQDSFPETFKEGFQLLRNRNNLSLEKMAELMNMADSTLRRWLDGPEDKLSIDFVVTVSLVMKLPDCITICSSR